MDSGYVVKGVIGKTCSECRHYQPGQDNPKKGKCFEYDVLSTASCKFFRKKG